MSVKDTFAPPVTPLPCTAHERLGKFSVFLFSSEWQFAGLFYEVITVMGDNLMDDV